MSLLLWLVNPVRVHGQDAALEVLAGPAQLAQSDWPWLRLLNGMGLEQIMDGLVGGNKGPTVGQLEPFLRERAAMPKGTEAQGRFLDQMQGQARFDSLGGLARPTP
jgi:hypothetical protein